MTRVADALAAARAAGIDSLDAQLILARVLATTRTRLIAHDERELTADESASWSALMARRRAGEPLAYLLGEKEFHGLMLEVDRDVLVPRPETELLVDWASELIADRRAKRTPSGASDTLRLVDLGTGSGAIALALKQAWPWADVTATDLSEATLAVARRNAARLGLAVEFIATSWWQGLGERRFDLALANPPYIAAGDPHLASLGHEPALALTSGGDGLDALRAIAAGAPDAIAPQGWLLVEHGFDQGAAVRALLNAAGLNEVQTRRDLAGLERATGGRRGPD